MANVITVTVRAKDETSGLSAVESKFKAAGSASGKGFSDEFGKSTGRGMLGSLFGKSSGSVTSDAQRTGQNVGLGLGRGIMQKFSQTLGSGLLSGLFGTSGGSKLFGSAGNTVVQDAARQGQNIAQGLGKGLNDGLGGTQNKISGVLSGLFGSGGSSGADAENAGENTGKSFTRGLSSGFSKAGSSITGMLSGLFGGSGAGPDEKAGEDAGKDAGNGFFRGLTTTLTSHKGSLGSALGGIFGGGKSGDSGGGGGGGIDAAKNALNAGGVAGGALPGIGGISGFASTVAALGAALISVLPAITAVVGGLGAIGGGFAILELTNKKFAASMSATLGGITKVFAAAAAPMAKPLEEAATQIGGFFKQIGPDLKDVFSAAVPLIQPLVKGFESLMSGAGPGFLAMIKSAGPVFASMAASFGDLGKDLGSMFADFAADGAGSATILKALLDLIGSLLPFLGELGKVLVAAIAPALAAFTAAISMVLPALTPLLKIVGAFAGAVLTDLAGVLGAVGSLLVDLAPSFTLLAKVAASLFTTLENAGVFAILGDALENMAAPLAGLINALVKGLAPALPGIVTLIGQMSTVIISLVSAGLDVLINALTSVVKWLSPVLPLLLDAVVAWKALTIAVGVFNAVMDFNPFAAIALALIAVTGLIIKYHTQILAFIERVWRDVFGFLKSLWGDILSFAGQWWPLLLGPGGLIIKYHNQMFSEVRGIWNSIVSWFSALPGRVIGALASLGGDLLRLGSQMMSDLWSGLKSGASGIVGWLGSFAKSVISVFKTIWGWFSPSRVMYEGGKALMTGLAGGLHDHANKAIAKASAVGSAVTGALSASAAQAQAMARQMAASLGWNFTDLNNVAMRESGWSMTAKNPSSGAYGIAQFINGPSEYAQYGGNVNTLSGQLTAFFAYISQRYGNPTAAWQHEQQFGWYAGGGATSPGWAMVGEHGRELVKMPGGATVVPHGAAEQMVAGGALAGGLCITLELGDSFRNIGLTDAQLKDLRYTIRTKGGGNVQRALGTS